MPANPQFVCKTLPPSAMNVWAEFEALLAEFSAISGHKVDWVKAAEILGPAIGGAFLTGGPVAAVTAGFTALFANLSVIFPAIPVAIVESQLKLFQAGYLKAKGS